MNYHPISIGWFAIEDVSVELIYFIFGIVFSQQIIEYKEHPRRDTFVSAALIGGSMVMFLIKECWACDFAISIFMIVALLLIAKCLNRKDCRAIKYIGKRAFVIYLYSWPVQAVTEIVMTVIFRCDWLTAWIGMFASGIAIPIILIVIYKKFVPENEGLSRMLGVDI